jgi:hypothetical protein
VQWQSSARDEDGPDTIVYFSSSADLTDWSAPAVLAGPRENAIVTSGGWWHSGDELNAYLNIWPQNDAAPAQGHGEFIFSRDATHWSEPQALTDAEGAPMQGVFEQDPRVLADGRILSAFHMQPGLVVAPYFTDDPRAVSGWTQGVMENLPHDGAVSRELEPSWFVRGDGAIVMIFRDQAETFQTLASVSNDRGESWRRPELINFPDSRSKQSAGNLPDGSVFRVNNPSGSRSRIPLVLSLSGDGRVFDRAWLLRGGGADLQPGRTEGRYKRPGYSYPKSIVIGDYLYVAYATNKEDIEITRVPWRGLRQ